MPTTSWSRMEAERAFERARRAHRRATLVCRLRLRRERCGCLAVVEPGAWRAASERVREIPLTAIRGTVEPNRAADFDCGFHPTPPARSRWQRLWLAEHNGTVLPPISVVRVGDRYAIRDGRAHV